MDSSEHSNSVISYDEEGVQYEFFTVDSSTEKNPVIKSKIISTRVASGKYREEFYKNGVSRFIDFITFLDNGNTIKKERFSGDTILGSAVIQYTNDKLIRSDELKDKTMSSQIYYYSQKDFLDSLVTKTNNVSTGKSIFINNDFGDPIYYEEYDNASEIVEKRWMKYKYDEKGNWVRQLFKSEGEKVPKIGFPENRFPGFSLIVREIKY